MSLELVSIGQAARMIGVAVATLRRWEKEEKFGSACRTVGGHRRYKIADITATFFPSEVCLEKRRKTVAYARVSSHDQHKDLTTQMERLSQHCRGNNYAFEVISDLGSGLNFKKRGLQKLLQMICRKEIDRLILTHRDCLLRFGSGLLFQLCANFGIEVCVLDDEQPKDFNQELAADIVEIITVFSAKVYGKRSHAHRKKLDKAA